MKKLGAGLMMYRLKNGEPELLLVHPGGPFFQNKDEGCWSIPKGQADQGEEGDELLAVAKREFEEETSFKPEGEFSYVGIAKRERDGKQVYAWAFEGDCDPTKISSNKITIDWPPGSGTKLEVPETDRGGFFTFAEARRKISSYMAPLIDLLAAQLT